MAGGTLAQKQMKKMGKKASDMTALEVAMLGRGMEQKASGAEESVALDIDEQDDDWNKMVEEAKGRGVVGWLGSRTAKKVDFRLNGARFEGRLGHAVKAGVVPLFDGAAIDMKSAAVKAVDPKKANSDAIQGDPKQYRNWVTGEGGVLVLAPVGMDNAVPVRMNHVVVTEKGLSGQAAKQMEFRKGNLSVKADGLLLKDHEAELIGAEQVEHGDTDVKSHRTASLTGTGLKLGPEDPSAPATVAQAVQDASQNTSAASSTEDTASSQNASTASSQNASTTDDTEPVLQTAAVEDLDSVPNTSLTEDMNATRPAVAEDKNDVANIRGDESKGKRFQNWAVDTVGGALGNLALGEESEKDAQKQKKEKKQMKRSLGTKLKEGGIAFGKSQGIDAGIKAGKAVIGLDPKTVKKKKVGMSMSGRIKPQEGDVHLNIGYGTNKVPKPTLPEQVGQGALNTVKDAVASSLGDTVRGNFSDARERYTKPVGNLVNAVSKTKESIEDGTALETLKKAPGALKSYLLDGTTAKDVKSDMMNAANSLTSMEDLQKLLGMDEEEPEKKSIFGDIPLVCIPIVIPAITFDVTLSPKFNYKFYADVSGENLRIFYKDLLKMQERESDSGTAKLKLAAGLKTSLSLEARAGFSEGIPFLIQGFEGIKASTKLGGALGESDEAVEAGIELPFEKKKSGKVGLANKDISAGLKGAFSLTGSVGAEASLQSKLFVWKKTLAEVEFAKWRLATIGLNLGLTKKAGSKGLFGGWEMDEASVSLKGPSAGLGKAFVEGNTPEKKYGLTTPDAKETEQYKDLQENFNKALELLKHFANPPQNEALAIPTDASDNGLVDTAQSMENLTKTFTNTWAQAQIALEDVDQQLEEYINSRGAARKEAKAIDKMNKHTSRVSGLLLWKSGQKDKDGKEIGIRDYYGSLGNSPGRGFQRALVAKAQDRAWTFEKIAAYEKKRYLEVTHNVTERIGLLQRMMADGKSTDEEIIKAYSKTKGSGKVFDHKAQMVGSADDIIAFEFEKMRKSQEEAREHQTQAKELSTSKDVEKAKEKARKTAKADKRNRKSNEEIEKLANEAGLKEFFRLYAKSLDKTQALQYGSLDGLLQYEKSRLDSYGKKNTDADMKAYERAKGGQAFDPNQDAKKAEEYKKLLNKELYRTATLEDLIEFEKSKNRGNTGALLESYLADPTKQQKTDENMDAETLLNNVFSPKADSSSAAKFKARHHAISKFKERYIKRKPEEDIKFLTLEMLIDYAKKRKEKAKSSEDQKTISRELSYLQNASLVVETTDPDKAAEVEANQIKQYFNRFEGTQKQYRRDLSEGREVNLKLMQDVLTNGGDNKRLEMLNELSKDRGDALDFEILNKYMAMTGAKEEELSAFMRKKQGDTELSAQQIERFHASRLSTVNGDVGKHFNRYMKLSQIAATGVTYSKLIDEYKKMGGTDGYSDFIKKEVEKGVLYGKDFSQGTSVEDVLRYEADRVKNAGADHRKLIDFVRDNKDSMEYKDLLAEYENQSKELEMGAFRKLFNRHITSLSSDYEKSKKNVVLSPQEVLDWEIEHRKQKGSKHAGRLMKLFGVEELPDDLDSLTAPTDEAVREERRKEYMEVAKRFKKDDDVKLAVTGELENLSSTDESLHREMLEYEEGRLDYYSNAFKELVDAREQIRVRQELLRQEIDISQSVVNHISDIREHPEDIFSKIAQFEEAVKFNEDRGKREKEYQEQQQRVIEEALKKKEAAEKAAAASADD